MTQLVFFLEERSAKEMLSGVLPQFLPVHIETRFVVFNGKQDLKKRLLNRLRGWQNSEARFVVMCDQDSGDCAVIKQGLIQTCIAAGKPACHYLVRIACRELESFYLGDLAAVETAAIGASNIARRQRKEKFRNPDRLGTPSQELKSIAPDYEKVSGSRTIGPLMDIENNCSHSFNTLIDGVRRLVEIN